MGGCRCTYRNCNVKSDGKTHMFHYPVFEKFRCHQWLVNAQRLDFLDLKVSQLKNRCVCQHHFKPDNFMNYKRDKLTFEAIPTLDGPYCDPSKFVAAGSAQEYPIPILVEDIENDLYDVNDKKSNFSVKYGDFLTNNEFADSSARYNRNNINLSKDNPGISLNSNLCNKTKMLPAPPIKKLSLPTSKINKTHSVQVVPPYSDFSNELKMGKELKLEQNVTDSQLHSNPKGENTFGLNIPLIQLDNSPKSDQVVKKKEPRIKILSEKKIEDPIEFGHINIAGKFEILSPSHPITVPDKNVDLSNVVKLPEITQNTLTDGPANNPPDEIKVLEVLDVEYDPMRAQIVKILNKQNNVTTNLTVLSKDIPVQNYQNNVNTVQTDHVTTQDLPFEIEKDIVITNKKDIILAQASPKSITQIKNKVTPERSAVIEKKRKFNLKLKDIIESCLDKLDDPEKNIEISHSLNSFEKPVSKLNHNNETLQKTKTKKPEEKAISLLKKDASMPNVQDNTIAYLEERMKQMENTLLNKIAQNKQEIIDFKSTWEKDTCTLGTKRKERSNKRFVSTQTNENETSYKKFLYQEISKYLSPSANSMIYEELFINKYSHEEVKSPLKRKRRKCT